MRTLVELLERMERLGDREALRYSNGYRTWRYSYREVLEGAARFAGLLEERGIGPGSRILLWGENRPEWLYCFWGAVARGVILVPLDFHFSANLAARIHAEASAALTVHDGSVPSASLPGPQVSFAEIAALETCSPLAPHPAGPEDAVEIVYTSGATGTPKGVAHRHRNICANLTPIAREMERYERYARPFQPIRILNLLPLSHMFGQAMGLFVPVLLGGAVVLLSEWHPAAILRSIRRERVSVVAAVPRLLRNLREEIERRYPHTEVEARRKGWLSIAERWWRHRKLHRDLGWKFWALVVGGAQLDSGDAAFWSRLGYLVVEGYGMTETSPMVALNHPFSARAGSIGKPLPGVEVRIAPDGEILVRGDNVVTSYTGAAAGEIGLEDGWLHTGDLGEMDAEGRLYFKGRKKEVIVTAEGLNVYPEDVEKVVEAQTGVRACAVVPLRKDGQEKVHAVLILEPGAPEPDALVGAANRQLEAFQHIASWSIWPEPEFPRTASTMKLKRTLIAAAVGGNLPAEAEAGAEGLDAILIRLTGKRAAPESRLAEDLGIGSLDRVRLLSELEEAYALTLDEEEFSRIETAGELREWLERKRAGSAGRTRSAVSGGAAEPAATAPPAHRLRDPGRLSWSRSRAMVAFRAVFLELVVLPLTRLWAPFDVEGSEHLADLVGPVIFAANHASLLDTPVVFRALPWRWRYRLAPAMAQDFFRAWFEPGTAPLGKRLLRGLQFYLAVAVFAAYPLPQRITGVRRALQLTGGLVDKGWSPLVFPEGGYTHDGRLQRFEAGIGAMASRLAIPVVPLYLQGLFEVLSYQDRWPRRHRVTVRIGPALRFDPETPPEEIVRRTEQAIRDLAGE
jgi:long-chain acyl-CoA synthetase